MKALRIFVWIYLILLIFEGALRKWIIPALDAPLLIIRDPVVIVIYFLAIRQRLSFANPFFVPNLALALATAFTATLFGQGNIAITIYGIRTDFLQIPLIFLLPQIINRDDIIVMGRFILWAALPISALAILQFLSPGDNILNKGAMATHYGTVRPSSVFSFVSGMVSFFDLTAAFIFFGYLQGGIYKIWLLGFATFAVLLASGCSGSRVCLVSIGMVAVVAILCVVIRGKGAAGMIVAAVLVCIAFSILSSFSVFQEGTDQLLLRFDDAGRNEAASGGFVGRFFSTFLGPLGALGDAPIFGNGLGLGTNAGAAMLQGEHEFSWPENEWGRLIFESGPILGLFLCIFRTALAITVGWRAFLALRRDNMLPLLIFSGCGLLIFNGQWGVPTALGFAIFGAGLTLAACEVPPEKMEDDEEHEDEHVEGEGDEPESAEVTR